MRVGLVLLSLAVAMPSSPSVRDVSGVARVPLAAPRHGASAVFFVSHECPISNRYSREIRRICDDYRARGLQCTLVYVDPSLGDAAAAAHARDYGHGAYARVVDREHSLVRHAGVRMTPEVAVVDRSGELAYRGRIDDFFHAWGQSRREVREHTLRNALDALLVGRRPPRSRTEAIGCFIPSRPQR